MKWLMIATVAIAAVALGVRSYRALSGPPLQPWHTFVPHELRVDELDDSDWSRYLAQEQAIFESVRANVSQRLDPDARVPYNRYFEQSPVYPGRFKQDWNRSYVMDPRGQPVGVVVLLHGLTDSPTACGTSRSAFASVDSSPSGCACPGTERSRPGSPTCAGKTGWPPRGWPCARHASVSLRLRRCTSSDSRTGARWR